MITKQEFIHILLPHSQRERLRRVHITIKTYLLLINSVHSTNYDEMAGDPTNSLLNYACRALALLQAVFLTIMKQ